MPFPTAPLPHTPITSQWGTDVVDTLAERARWVPFTPTWNNVQVGDASQHAHYRLGAGMLHVIGHFVLGAGSSVTGTLGFRLPANYAASALITNYHPVGQLTVGGNGSAMEGVIKVYGTSAIFYALDRVQPGDHVKYVAMNATLPVAFASGHSLDFQLSVPVIDPGLPAP